MKVKEQLWDDREADMALLPPSKSAFVGVSEGTHVAICNMIVDLGMQDGGKYGLKHQILVQFEVPGERVSYTDDSGVEKEGPRTISKFYNFTLVEGSILRKDLESWRGRAFAPTELIDNDGKPIFDITTVIAKPCQLSVIKSEKGKSLISAIMGLPKGFPIPPLESEAIVYDGDNQANLSKLSNGIQDMIKKGVTKPQAESASHANQDIPFDDAIPF